MRGGAITMIFPLTWRPRRRVRAIIRYLINAAGPGSRPGSATDMAALAAAGEGMCLISSQRPGRLLISGRRGRCAGLTPPPDREQHALLSASRPRRSCRIPR